MMIKGRTIFAIERLVLPYGSINWQQKGVMTLCTPRFLMVRANEAL